MSITSQLLPMYKKHIIIFMLHVERKTKKGFRDKFLVCRGFRNDSSDRVLISTEFPADLIGFGSDA